MIFVKLNVQAIKYSCKQYWLFLYLSHIHIHFDLKKLLTKRNKVDHVKIILFLNTFQYKSMFVLVSYLWSLTMQAWLETLKSDWTIHGYHINSWHGKSPFPCPVMIIAIIKVFFKSVILRGGPDELKHSDLPKPWDFYY